MQILTVKYVAESLEKLRKLGAHRNILMYLCIKRASAQQKTVDNIKIDFREFFEYFLILRNAPTDKNNKPFYIVPFESSDAKIWLNRNLSGSFASSSIRPDNPVNTVIALNGTGSKVTYTLRKDHAKQAFNNLLNGTKIPALDLAVFLYRDFGFNSDEMDADKLLGIFKSEFGYQADEEVSDFDEVFSYFGKAIPQDLFVPFFQG